jgi:plasmid maintenance system antidote protein VapI
VPEALSSHSLRVRFGEPADAVIQVGQVWLARWEDVTALALVLAADGRHVLGVPISIDPPREDERCIVISPALTVFPIDVTVWMGLERAVPIRVLERQVDQWNEEIAHLIQQWSRNGGDLPQGMRSGRPLSDEFDPSALARAEIADDLDALIDAPGLPTVSPGETRQDLASLLRGKLDLAALCTALRLPQPEVMTILRGKAPLTTDQIVVVASVTGLTIEEVAQSVRPLPLELVVEAEHPRWRLTWQHQARTHGVTEAEARLTASYGAYALAARETRVTEPHWDQRLREFLRDEAEPPSAS